MVFGNIHAHLLARLDAQYLICCHNLAALRTTVQHTDFHENCCDRDNLLGTAHGNCLDRRLDLGFDRVDLDVSGVYEQRAHSDFQMEHWASNRCTTKHDAIGVKKTEIN